jgi:hypothetical protein
MDNKIKIEGLLKDNPRGLTIQDLVNKTDLAWNTITKVLALLQGENKIEVRIIGQAKLHYWNIEKPKRLKLSK